MQAGVVNLIRVDSYPLRRMVDGDGGEAEEGAVEVGEVVVVVDEVVRKNQTL